MGLTAILRRLDNMEGTLNGITASSHGGLANYLDALETLVLKNAKAPDGGLIPPLRLIHSVAGTPNVDWFFEGGRLGYQSILDVLIKNELKISNFNAILDFGCGCGRVIRYWSDLKGPAIYGSDYNPVLIDWCRKNFLFARFEKNEITPSLPFGDKKFDFIYALSIFTHLPEHLQYPWMRELWRVLMSGGYLIITTCGEHYFDRLDDHQKDTFRSNQIVVKRAEMQGTNACAAYHPFDYVRAKLATDFNIVDFIPKGAKGNPEQDLYLLKKP